MTLVLLFIECLKEQAENVKRLVKQVHGVSEAHSVSTGRYDVIVKVETEDEQKLKNVVYAIKGIAGIVAVVASITYGNING